MTEGLHRKVFHFDRFGRRYYCKHARLGMIHTERKKSNKACRKLAKEQIKEGLQEYDKESF